MDQAEHFAALERMYMAGPINRLYRPEISVSEGGAVVEMDVSEDFFHAGRSLHGSVYFKMLDDAAFFAANSLEREVFVLTASFTTRFRRPVRGGGDALRRDRRSRGRGQRGVRPQPDPAG